MRAVTIKEAKAKLNELIDAATRGEEIVLLRGSEHVAAIVPITEADLEFAPRLSDRQAAAFWERLAAERRAGPAAAFGTAEEAVEYLRARKPRGAAAGRKRAPRSR